MTTNLNTLVVPIYFVSSKNTIESKIFRARLNNQLNKFIVIEDFIKLKEIFSIHCLEHPNKTLQLILESIADFNRVRILWEKLTIKIKPDLCLRFDFPESEKLPQNWLIDINCSSSLKLQNFISALEHLGSFAVLTNSAPMFWPDNVTSLTLSTNPYASLIRCFDLININNSSNIVFTNNPKIKDISKGFWKQLFASSIPKILTIDQNCTLNLFRFFPKQAPFTLFIFPDSILPIKRAFLMRAFDLILGLAYADKPPAVIFFGPNSKDLEKIRQALEVFSPNVTAKFLIRKKLKFSQKLIRWSELGIRKIIGLPSTIPLRYSERRIFFATKENRELINETIYKIPSIKNVIYTGSWFSDTLNLARKNKPLLRWFCDTHDVFFLVDATNIENDRYFFYCRFWQKYLELKDLALANFVIAISPADKDTLLKAGLKSKVLVESGSFSHSFSGLYSNESISLSSFGFIGSSNRNNKRCIELLHRHWWPEILKYNPKSKLRIAGAICASREVEMLSNQYPGSIVPVGFLDSVEKFYSSTAIVLSPILVTGGLNFKSVEALMAGCFLLSTKLGLRCLNKKARGVYIIDSTSSNIHKILNKLNSIPNLISERALIRSECAQIYGDNKSYAKLIYELSK